MQERFVKSQVIDTFPTGVHAPLVDSGKVLRSGARSWCGVPDSSLFGLLMIPPRDPMTGVQNMLEPLLKRVPRLKGGVLWGQAVVWC